MKTTIFVEPVKRNSKQGRHKAEYIIRNTQGEEISRNNLNRASNPRSTQQFSFAQDKNRMKLVTGLDEIITNPFFGSEVKDIKNKYSLRKEWDPLLEAIVSKEEITRQTYYEILDGVDPDYYTSNIKGDMVSFDAGSDKLPELTYLQRFKIVLYGRTNIFSNDTSRGRLGIQLVKNQRYIANSIDNVNSSIHRFYISGENEAEERTLARREKISAAFYSLEKLKREFTTYDRFKIATIIQDDSGSSLVTNRATDTKVKNNLFKFIDTPGNKQVGNCLKLIKEVEKLENVDSLHMLEIEFLTQLALNVGVLTARDGEVIWNSKREQKSLGKFSTLAKLNAFLLKEYNNYSPKGKETNFYKELATEVIQRDGWYEI